MTSTLRFLVYTFFLVFPLGLIFRFKIGSNIAIYPGDFVVLIILLTAFKNVSLLAKIVKKNKFLFFQAIFILIGFVSLCINYFIYKDINFITSVLYGVRYLSVLTLIPVCKLIGMDKNLRKIILFSGGTFLIFGYIQYMFFYDLRPLTYLGWDDHLYRLFSTFFDPNFAGLFYSMFAIYLLLEILKKPFSKSFLQIFLAFFTVVAIYLTYSRSALVAFFFGIISFLIFKRKFKFIAVSILALIFLLFLFKDSNIEGSNPLRIVSSSNRVYSLKQAISIIDKNPIFGVGFNAYRYAQVRYSTRQISGALRSNADAGSDDSYVFVLATTGVIGFAAFVLSYIFLFKEFIASKDDAGKIYASILISFLVGGLFVNLLFYIPIVSWFFIVIGLSGKNFMADK